MKCTHCRNKLTRKTVAWTFVDGKHLCERCVDVYPGFLGEDFRRYVKETIERRKHETVDE